MPSMTGIFTSVSSRSKSPFLRLSASSAAAPSLAAVSSWPSSLSARTTRSRIVGSSSAIRIFAIALLRSGILSGEEADHHIGGVDLRRRDLAAEFQPLAGIKDAARRRHGPAVDFLAGRVT